MKTTLDVLTILYGVLKNSSLASEITGKIRKGERPAGSTKEDIVINSLPINSDQLQRCVANVNLFVPDLTIKENGIQSSVPDYVRLDELSKAALLVLKDVRKAQDYYMDWQQQTLLKDEASNSHFINIRVNFYSYNILN